MQHRIGRRDALGDIECHVAVQAVAWVNRRKQTALAVAAVGGRGAVAGTPTCTIQAHDDSYSYTGTDAVPRTSPLEPGGVWYFKDDVTITNQGAQYVTQVNISCS